MKNLFDKISKDYDFLNNIISFFTHKIVKKEAIKALKIKNGAKVLDLCCGTGDLGRIIKDNCDVEVTGADISENMIKIALEKNKDIKYFLENAEKLSFKENEFDYIVMGFGLRNVQDKKRAIKEIKRVLKEDGLFLHLDFGEKNIFSKIYDIYLFIITSFLKNKEAYRYLIKSKNEFYSPFELVQFFEQNGFETMLMKKRFFGIISYQILKIQKTHS